MGSRLTSIRQDPSELNPTDDFAYAPPTGTRIRDLLTDGSGASSSRPNSRQTRSTNYRQSDSSNIAINRLITELENSGISNEDARLLRFIRNYRSSSHSSNQEEDATTVRNSRSQSIGDNWLLREALAQGLPSSSSRSHNRRGAHSHNQRGRRNRTTSLETSGSFENAAGTTEVNHPIRLASVGRHALLSLAAASARQRPWLDNLFVLSGQDRVCAFCKRVVPHDEYDLHYVMCLTRPRVTYNEDKLSVDKGECSICLEDLTSGQAIARLPCLCIYHKRCIDEWFERRQTCPEHPDD